MIDPRRLRHFLAVYENGSLGKAAQELHLTQPALSKSIHMLEEQLNLKLFDRTPLGVVPTVYGDALSQHAKIIKSELRNAERELTLLSGAAKGEVVVGATPSLSTNIIPRVVALLNRERPGIQLHMMEGLMEDHLPALRRGELDVIVGGWARGFNIDVKTEVIFQDEVGVFARHDHPLCGEAVDLSALLEYPFVMPPHTQFWMDYFETKFVSEGLSPPSPSAISNSASFIKGLLQEGNFLSFLPRELLVRDVEAGLLDPINVRDLSVQIDVNVTLRERSEPPSAVVAFIETLRAYCKGNFQSS